ncbi:hypothetical protein JJB99_00825 [Bradyrhizobium diazoefficiens]|uniref:hypothetical protein n=1 Tax=Bradyrhizobium diazoefficiens TaxID=1355477 RepID=UPI0019090AFB|nr:hypothetical protein [Bradyrhizobium diazoefficiens]QQO14775.1 hypothetical protein JJB99_00825 [Bradyrhizobium diazoefficiens]
MINNEESKKASPAAVDRRALLIAGASAAAATAIPTASSAGCAAPTCNPADQLEASLEANVYGAVYADPTYLDTFNNNWYSAAKVKSVQLKLQARWPNRNDMKWGLYQTDIETNPDKWGCSSAKGKIARNNWKHFAAEARFDLAKQPANFTEPKNRMNPFDSTKVAPNLIAHLDEVARVALYDLGIPVSICVGKKKHRHHGLMTEWVPAPGPGVTPTSVNISVDCPEGGWQGYGWWRTRSQNEHLSTFTANWTVPAKPTQDHDQLIFIFNGFESESSYTPGGILQAVLQYYRGHWRVRCWYVTAAFNPDAYPTLPGDDDEKLQPDLNKEQRCYTKSIEVSPNDLVTGTITRTDASSGKFNYVCTITVNNDTSKQEQLSMTDIPELVYAVCAVESYDLDPKKRDKEYPANPMTLSGLSLGVDPISPDPIAWSTNTTIGHDFITSTTDGGQSIEFVVRPPKP